MSDAFTIRVRRQDLHEAIGQIVSGFEANNDEIQQLREQIDLLKEQLAEVRREAVAHELVKLTAVAEVAELEQQLSRMRQAAEDETSSLNARLQVVREQLDTAENRAKESVQQEMAALRTARLRVDREFDDFQRSVAECAGCDMDEFDLPAEHGNHRLRRAILIGKRINLLKESAEQREAGSHE